MKVDVCSKIRAIVLDLEIFTVAQMGRVTTLNPVIIRAELQRMEREGYLTSESISEDKLEYQYCLTLDPEKRLALSRSVERVERR